MLDDTLMRADVVQLLREASCPDEFTQSFLSAMETEDVKDQICLLRSQRCRQLERVHIEEKKLDHLDYLLYKLEKQLPPSKSGKTGRTHRKDAAL